MAEVINALNKIEFSSPVFYIAIVILLAVMTMFYTLFYYFGATGELADIVKEIIRIFQRKQK